MKSSIFAVSCLCIACCLHSPGQAPHLSGTLDAPQKIRSDLQPTNSSQQVVELEAKAGFGNASIQAELGGLEAPLVPAVKIDQFLGQAAAFRSGDFSAYPSKALGQGVLNAYAFLADPEAHEASEVVKTMGLGLSSRYAAPFALLALDRQYPKARIADHINPLCVPIITGVDTFDRVVTGSNLPRIPRRSELSSNSGQTARDFAQMGVDASGYYFETILLNFGAFTETRTNRSWVCPKAIDLWIEAGRQSAIHGENKEAAEALAVVLLYGDERQQAKAKELALAMAGGGQPRNEVKVKPEKIAEIANRYRKMNAHPRALSILKEYAPEEEELSQAIANEWQAILVHYGATYRKFKIYGANMPAKNGVMEIPLAGHPNKEYLLALFKGIGVPPPKGIFGPE